MCLTIQTRFRTRQEARDLQPSIAKKDMVVFKIISPIGISPYRNFKWEPGFHYYQDNCKLPKNIRQNYSDQWRVRVHIGLHAFTTLYQAEVKKRNWLSQNDMIVEMIVPKGAKYYLGENNDIVSTEMIYPKK